MPSARPPVGGGAPPDTAAGILVVTSGWADGTPVPPLIGVGTAGREIGTGAESPPGATVGTEAEFIGTDGRAVVPAGGIPAGTPGGAGALAGRGPPCPPALAEGGGMAGAGTCAPPGLAPPGFAPVRRIPMMGCFPVASVMFAVGAGALGVGIGGDTVQGAFGATGSSLVNKGDSLTGGVDSMRGVVSGTASPTGVSASASEASIELVNER